MKLDAQKVAIAELCGTADRWVLVKHGLYYRPQAHGYTGRIEEAWILSESEVDLHVYPHGDDPVTKHRAPLPNYPGDLNAMRQALSALNASERDAFLRELQIIVDDEVPGGWFWACVNASA